MLVIGLNHSFSNLFEGWHFRTGRLVLGPGPGVSEPELRDDMKRSRVGSSIVSSNSDRHSFGAILILSILEGESFGKLLGTNEGEGRLTSMNTSQYLLSSNASVSVISNSSTSLPRLLLSRTSRSYGYSRWGY